MEKAKIFQSIVKGSNFFTPIVDSYYTVGNHIVELSCSEKDNWRGRYDKIINGITFKGKYGVTVVITNEGDGWKRSTELDKLCDSRDEAIKYIKSLDKKVVPKCSNCERLGTMECPKVSIVILLKQNHFFKPKQDE